MSLNSGVLAGTVIKPSQLTYTPDNLAVWKIAIAVAPVKEGDPVGMVLVEVFGDRAAELGADSSPLSPIASQKLVDEKRKIMVQGKVRPAKNGTTHLILTADSVNLIGGRTVSSRSRPPVKTTPTNSAPAPRQVEQQSLLAVATPATPKAAPIGDQATDIDYDDIPF